jgi:hypothetical protein
MKPLIQFGLVVRWGKRPPFTIRFAVFGTVPQMRKVARTICSSPDSYVRRSLGVYVAHPGRDPFGTVMLARRYLGAGYVAHEIMHALLDVLFRFKFDRVCVRSRERPGSRMACPAEETLCQLASLLHRQFWKRWYAFERKEKRNGQ